MKKFLAFIVLLLAVLGTNAQSRTPEHRIVIQLTSGDTTVYAGLFKQMNNLTSGWGDSVTIEVVCHGPGVNFLMTAKQAYPEKIYAFQKKGIRFVVCENTLRERKIDRSEIMPGMDYVRMGIAEIVLKQEQGWSYIKAGN